MILNFSMIVVTFSFSLTLLAKIPNCVGCSPVVLLTMLLTRSANPDSSSIILLSISIDMLSLWIKPFESTPKLSATYDFQPYHQRLPE